MIERKLLLVSCLAFGLAQSEKSKVVQLTQGPVRGYKALNSEVFEFFGIPYATAPNGTNKFKAPLPPPTWTETLEGVDDTIACPQNPSFAIGLNVQEDCLVANVLVPDTPETNLPVLVYIHGGAYLMGHGQLNSPKPLVESKKIVAVTFNYRLGPLGFLCLGTEDVPGNAGLKDQLALLRWVKSNIATFGGNPDDVTLAGYSAGASAVDLMMLSKVAEGLFNKVIPESGSNLAPWVIQIDPLKTANDYARKLKFNNVGNFEALEQFYKTISYELLFSDPTLTTNPGTDFDFMPCLEKDLGQERVLEDLPINIIQRGEYKKIPILYGFANMEGMFRMPQFDSWARLMNENFTAFLPHDLQFKNNSEKEAITRTIKEFYFGHDPVGLYKLFDYIDFFSDILFFYPQLRSLKLQIEAGSNSIYLYYYTFYERFPSIPGVPDVLVNFPGANHCAQTEAVLHGTTINEEHITEKYKQLRTNIRELWINFITNGNPVPEGSTFPAWPPANADRSPYMIIGDNIELDGGSLIKRRFQFWDGIYEQYYRYSVPSLQPEESNTKGGL